MHSKPHTEEAKRKMSLARKGKGLGNMNGKGQVPWNKGKKLTDAHRIALSMGSKGKGIGNKNALKHGKTYEYSLIRGGTKYQGWRKRVLARDNNTCQMPGCGKKERLEAHHIIPMREILPEYGVLIYQDENGITICKKCHSSLYKKEHAFSGLFNQIVANQYL